MGKFRNNMNEPLNLPKGVSLKEIKGLPRIPSTTKAEVNITELDLD